MSADFAALPCPFCGNAPTIEISGQNLLAAGVRPNSGSARTTISCDCDASPIVVGQTEKLAMQRWNTRADHAK